jgi:hypothetical protein
MLGGCSILLAFASAASAMEGHVEPAWAAGMGGRVALGVPGEVGLGVVGWGGRVQWNPDSRLLAGGVTAAVSPGVYLASGKAATFSVDVSARASFLALGCSAFAQGRFPLGDRAEPGARFGLGLSGGLDRVLLVEGRIGGGFDAGPDPRGVLLLELTLEGGAPIVVR